MATVIFKPTEICNARCVYCDVVHKEQTAIGKMSYEMLEIFFIRINEYLLDNVGADMEVIWHGGEPLLLGPPYFAKALEFQQKHCETTSSRIRHSVQSNLTLFTPAYTEVLKKLGINGFGTSYDPFSTLRGIGTSVDSTLYNKKFIRGIRHVEREGFSWGLIYVVTKLSLDKPIEIFRHLVNFHPYGGVMFNPVIIYDNTLDYLRITPEEFTNFLGAIFPVWWADKERFPQVEPFSPLFKNLIEGERSLTCGDAGDCAQTHINLAPDGRLSQCGRSSDWKLLDYGSIYDKTFTQVFADPQRMELMERNLVLPQGECKGCRYWDICHGGCPLDAWHETRSFMHKTSWCSAKRDFIEKYFEPVIKNGAGKESAVAVCCDPRPPLPNLTIMRTNINGKKPLWINPIGGLGDTLMISGVLKQFAEKFPSRKFNMVTRTKYDPMLKGHPAIGQIGHPPPGANFISTNYWDEPDYGVENRAYQLLARIFGLDIPMPETLYVPFKIEPDKIMKDFLPLKKYNILICPSSDSPRKQMSHAKWEALTRNLLDNGTFIVQVGRATDIYVRGAYNLLGLTNPKELIGLLSIFDCIITCDNFIMHAAHLCNIPAVVLWGPTNHRVYGYEEQAHFQAKPVCTISCIGAGKGHLYGTHCPQSVHCMDQIDIVSICQAAWKIINN
jgi:uncharacterized protein